MVNAKSYALGVGVVLLASACGRQFEYDLDDFRVQDEGGSSGTTAGATSNGGSGGAAGRSHFAGAPAAGNAGAAGTGGATGQAGGTSGGSAGVSGGAGSAESGAAGLGNAGEGGAPSKLPILREEEKFYPGLEFWGHPLGGVLVHTLCPLGEVLVGLSVNTKFDANNNIHPVSFSLRCAELKMDGSLGPTHQLATSAGTGAFVDTAVIDCPPSEVAVGVSGYLTQTTFGTSFVFSLGLSCASFSNWMNHVKSLNIIGPVGTATSMSMNDNCPDGWGVMKGFSARVGAFLDGVRVRCVQARVP